MAFDKKYMDYKVIFEIHRRTKVISILNQNCTYLKDKEDLDLSKQNVHDVFQDNNKIQPDHVGLIILGTYAS